MKKQFFRPALALFFVVATSHLVSGQRNGEPEESAAANSNQLAGILGLDTKLSELRALRTKTSGSQTAARDERVLRQDLVESIQSAALEVEGVLAVLANE